MSISADVTINMIRVLITDDSLLTQCEIAAHLGIGEGIALKVCCHCLIVCCSQYQRGKFFSFCKHGSYRRAIYPIDLYFWLLLRNTLFFTHLGLNNFLLTFFFF